MSVTAQESLRYLHPTWHDDSFVVITKLVLENMLAHKVRMLCSVAIHLWSERSAAHAPVHSH